MTSTTAKAEYERHLAEAVSRGIALLNAYGPENWLAKIDPQDLNLQASSQCVLGQVYGEFNNGVKALEVELGTDLYAAAYGFEQAILNNGEDQTPDAILEQQLADAAREAYPENLVNWRDREQRIWQDLTEEWLRQLGERGVRA